MAKGDDIMGSTNRPRLQLEALEDRLTPSTNAVLLPAFYQALLKRGPDFPGATTFANEINSGTPAPGTVALQIETAVGHEYYTDLVQSWYVGFLHRQGSAGEMQGYVQELAEGVSNEAVESQILGSTEYFQTRGGGTAAGWLNAVYQDLLQRAWDGSSHLSQLSGGISRQALALEIMFDPGKEFATKQVNVYYSEFLDRSGNGDAGAASFASQLQAGQMTDEQIIAAILGGAEFSSLHQPVIGGAGS
jgi:hypothetical protein